MPLVSVGGDHCMPLVSVGGDHCMPLVSVGGDHCMPLVSLGGDHCMPLVSVGGEDGMPSVSVGTFLHLKQSVVEFSCCLVYCFKRTFSVLNILLVLSYILSLW